MTQISVIVPAYNVEQYINQCIESILSQTFKDFEVIVVDDGSKDKTGTICEDFLKKDSRVKVIHKENGGLVSARKAGLRVAEGIYIAYVDGDDWIKKDMLEDLYLTAKKENADITIADFIYGFPSGDKLFTQNMSGGVINQSELIHNVFPSMMCTKEYYTFRLQPSLCSKLFKKSILMDKQMAVCDNIKLGEDAACFYPTLLTCNKVVYLKEKYFYYYRMRESSISHSIHKDFYTDDIIELIALLYDDYQKYSQYWNDLSWQLWLYFCYMVDNMITPNITFSNVFLKNDLMEQCKKISNHVIWEKLGKQYKGLRTSSNMRRVIDFINKPNWRSKCELFLFHLYEKRK